MKAEDNKKYQEFLEQKKQTRTESGFDISEDAQNQEFFPLQKYCVRRALQTGKFAMFEDCGLGRTIQQLEWAQKLIERIDKPVLILAPLAVISQTIKEGQKLGYIVKEISETSFAQDLDAGIYITNYENMKNIDVHLFSGVVLDESSIPKNSEFLDEMSRTEMLAMYSCIMEAERPTPSDERL